MCLVCLQKTYYHMAQHLLCEVLQLYGVPGVLLSVIWSQLGVCPHAWHQVETPICGFPRHDINIHPKLADNL